MGDLRPALHFVGFRGDEYRSAVRVWGVPDFYHHVNDRRQRREIATVDTVVFANGCEARPARFNGADIIEQEQANAE